MRKRNQRVEVGAPFQRARRAVLKCPRQCAFRVREPLQWPSARRMRKRIRLGRHFWARPCGTWATVHTMHRRARFLLLPRGIEDDSRRRLCHEEYCAAEAHDGERSYRSVWECATIRVSTSSAGIPTCLAYGRVALCVVVGPAVCMTRGYSFGWDAGESPKLLLPKGGSREVEVGHSMSPSPRRRSGHSWDS